MLTNREMAASCMDMARLGGTHCARRFLLGMKRRERHGKNMNEMRAKRRVQADVAVEQKDLSRNFTFLNCFYNKEGP